MATYVKSLVAGTRVWTDAGVFTVEEVSNILNMNAMMRVENHLHVYDGWGRKSRIVECSRCFGEKGVVPFASDGVMFMMAQDAVLMSYAPGEPFAKLRDVPELAKLGMFYLAAPTRKVRLSRGTLTATESGNIEGLYNCVKESDRIEQLAACYAGYESREDIPQKVRSQIYLKPDTVEQFTVYRHLAGFYGIWAFPHLELNTIELDPVRPSCFATKLFAGRGEDVPDLLADLVDSRIVTPGLPADELIKLAEDTGVIAEGENSAHLRSCVTSLSIVRMKPAFNLVLDGACSTVETSIVRF